jgi:hypothetical protein
VRGFFQRQRYIATDIAALALLVSTAPAEQVAKNIAERRKYIFDIVEVVRSSAIKASMTKTIVSGTLLRVAEHLERLGRFLKPVNCLLIARIFVRVIHHSQLAIRSRNLAVRGSSLNLQNFVIIALRSHGIKPGIVCRDATGNTIASLMEYSVILRKRATRPNGEVARKRQFDIRHSDFVIP